MKSKKMINFLKSLVPHPEGWDRKGFCVTCGKHFEEEQEFRDEVSRREYEISRMCQGCQDESFICLGK